MKKTTCIFCVLIAGGVALRAALFMASAQNLPVSSDESITILQAKQIRAGAAPIFFMGQPYLFPAESYMHAPFANILPRTPLGARVIAFLMGLAGMGCAMVVFLRLFRESAGWPGVLLILFPSTYLLIHQSGYAMPGYPTLLLCSSLCVMTALLSAKRRWCAFLSGLVAGAGFSTHMLILPAALAAGFFCIHQPGIGETTPSGAQAPDTRRAAKSRLTEPQDAAPPVWMAGLTCALIFAAGAMIGLTPWFAATFLYHGEHGALLQAFSIPDALRRIWSPIIRYTLPAAMGIAPVPFPDNQELNLWPRMELIFVWVWTALIAGGIFLAGTESIRRFQHRKPACAIHTGLKYQRISKAKISGMTIAPFYTMILLNLIVFALSRRADSGSFRYLLPTVWCFPFVVQHWFAAGWRRLRPVIGGLAILLAIYNIIGAAALTRLWHGDNFAAKYAGLPDLRPALDYLQSNNIRHCVASYGAAYRINFMTDEQIVCAQPLNERFTWWPTPYKDIVDASTNVAYVLTDHIRFLKPGIFERHLRVMHIAAESRTCGDFRVYHDFREMPRTPPQTRIAPEAMTISAGHNAGDGARTADNRVNIPGWSSGAMQKEGMWIEIRLREPARVCAVVMKQRRAEKFTPATFDVFTLQAGEWQPAALDTEPGWDKFVFHNGHPVYGIEPRVLEWPALVTDGLRLRIRRPHSDHPWAIDELEVFRQL